jgi:hypothetical protein
LVIGCIRRVSFLERALTGEPLLTLANAGKPHTLVALDAIFFA